MLTPILKWSLLFLDYKILLKTSAPREDEKKLYILRTNLFTPGPWLTQTQLGMWEAFNKTLSLLGKSGFSDARRWMSSVSPLPQWEDKHSLGTVLYPLVAESWSNCVTKANCIWNSDKTVTSIICMKYKFLHFSYRLHQFFILQTKMWANLQTQNV